MQKWQQEGKDYPSQGKPRGRKRNGAYKKVAPEESNNVGYYFRRQYRQIYAKAYMLIKNMKGEHDKIEITDEKRTALFNELLQDPFLVGKETITQKIVDNVIFMLMRNGDLVSTDLEKAEVFATHKQIIDESIQEKNYAAARAANRDLMEIYEFFPKPTQPTNNMLIAKMEEKLADGSSKAIAIATGPEFLAMLWEGKKLTAQKNDIIQIEMEEKSNEPNVRSIQEQEEVDEEEV